MRIPRTPTAGARKMQRTTPERHSVKRDKLCTYLESTLNHSSIADYSCNGLQVEGCETIYRVALAVDACMESFEAAVENDCQMIICHHGIIWGGITSLSGAIGRQARYLFNKNCNLFAAHLPLDLHAEHGNNAVLARQINLHHTVPFGTYKGVPIGCSGMLRKKVSVEAVAEILNRTLETSCTVLPFGKKTIHSIGIVSGGGSDALGEAIDKNLDCFITGESSHENYHMAREAGINVIYAGHYHTEKGGVLALGTLIEKTFSLETCFLDLPTII